MGRTVESVDVLDDLLTGGDYQGEASTHGIADVVEDKGVIGVGDGNHRDPELLADGKRPPARPSQHSRRVRESQKLGGRPSLASVRMASTSLMTSSSTHSLPT